MRPAAADRRRQFARRSSAALALGLFLLWAPTADAASASLAVTTAVRDDQDCSSGKSCAPIKVRDYTATLRLNAEPGERNDVTVEFTDAFGPVTIKDASAPLFALGGCEQIAPSSVRCHPGTPPADSFSGSAGRIVNASLADRDDRLATAGADPTAGSIGSLSTFTQLNVLGQDGADVIDVFGGRSGLAEGGPGNDAITASAAAGGDGDDMLTGGPFANRLDGGPGADQLAGGEGDDDLLPGTGVDRVDGGPGIDRASWETSPVPVAVDLRGGAPASVGGSDADVVAAVENATGTPGSDRITGADGKNNISGLAGDDVISAAGGDDEIDAGPGRDLVGGGAGNDRLESRGGQDRLSGDAGNDSLMGESSPETLSGGSGKDEITSGGGRDRILGESGNDVIIEPGSARVSCGKGRDKVAEPRVRALLPRDCELVDVFGLGEGLRPPQLTRAGARLRLGNLCQLEGRCRITVTLSTGRRRLGRRRVTIRRDRARNVSIPLSPGERALARKRPVRVTVRTVDSDGDSHSGAFTARMR